jgi:hypothetical protein
MALGKQIGEFSLKLISTTVSPGPGNVQTWQANFEGPVSGEAGAGSYVGTMTVVWEPGAKSGTWSACGATALTSGGTLGGSTQGTWEEAGSQKWRYRGSGRLADGRTVAVEFEGDVVTRTWAGKLYEWS